MYTHDMYLNDDGEYKVQDTCQRDTKNLDQRRLCVREREGETERGCKEGEMG
jgi:hypothetical protein